MNDWGASRLWNHSDWSFCAVHSNGSPLMVAEIVPATFSGRITAAFSLCLVFEASELEGVLSPDCEPPHAARLTMQNNDVAIA